MISVAEALARLLALAPAPDQQEIPLSRASGRALAAPVTARLTQPPFAASAMDGYAIREADHRPGARLQVIGEAGAGHGFAGQVGTGQAARIFTGAPVPAGAERVVLQEDVTRDGNQITLGESLEESIHIRPLGQDFKVGDQIAAPRRLRPADLALIAAMNVPKVTVARCPTVAILSTGDELVQPGEAPRADQIIASNHLAIAALCRAAGARPHLLPIARDTAEALQQSFDLAGRADVIVTIGGASVGDHDHVRTVAQDVGFKEEFWRIAMRPGKPLLAGRRGRQILLGLPGNPVSAIVTAHLFLLPLLFRLQGLPGGHDLRPARLAHDLPANGLRAHYMRARLLPGPDLPLIAPFDRQDSALLTILTEADALLVRPVDDGPRAAGERVDYLPL